jgi:dTDP-4-dehydrorhamnose 3,5-epimerase
VTVHFEPSTIAGVGRIAVPFFEDERGGFTKVFGAVALEQACIEFDVREMYWSRSHTGVIRGLHFQSPPAAVAKIVFTTQGVIRDVVLDLRVGSPTYATFSELELTETSGAVVIPRGCAHGFEVLDGPAVTCYLQDGPFDPAKDAGVRWDTAGVTWMTSSPIVSARDRALPRFETFESPFGPDGGPRVY